jgi:hypothetical protein
VARLTGTLSFTWSRVPPSSPQTREGWPWHVEPPVDATLPITPMLYMSFQLLSFFILTFHPVPAEGKLYITLPGVSALVSDQRDPSPDFVKDEYTIAISQTPSRLLIGLRRPTTVVSEMKTLPDLRDALRTLGK